MAEHHREEGSKREGGTEINCHTERKKTVRGPVTRVLGGEGSQGPREQRLVWKRRLQERRKKEGKNRAVGRNIVSRLGGGFRISVAGYPAGGGERYSKIGTLTNGTLGHALWKGVKMAGGRQSTEWRTTLMNSGKLKPPPLNGEKKQS